MPAFHSWGPSTQKARLPPTPPDYQTAYPTPTSAISDQSFYSSHSYPTRHGQSGRDFIDRYSQAPAYAAQQVLNTQAPSRIPQPSSARDFRQIPPYVQQISTQYPYGPVAAPILPPIRVQEPLDIVASQFPQAHPEPKQKEDKPTGGVAAHLDYDMDLMSSFVAEMAQGIVAPGVHPTTQFRKYVSQILSSTRLPRDRKSVV